MSSSIYGLHALRGDGVNRLSDDVFFNNHVECHHENQEKGEEPLDEVKYFFPDVPGGFAKERTGWTWQKF